MPVDIQRSQIDPVRAPSGAKVIPLIIIFGLLFTGCYTLRTSEGGGQTVFHPPRQVSPSSVALSGGYEIEAVATGLTFPTGVAFDDAGVPYVVESGYSYGEVWTIPRLLRIESDGTTRVIASGEKNGPWTGVAFYQGDFYVAEGGELLGGRLLRITPDGTIHPLIDHLPSTGDHHTNGPVIGPDGAIYFAIGTYTNAGIVGEDNAHFGWLLRNPVGHDIPCKDVTLKGENYTSRDPRKDPRHPGADQPVVTGAFSPFGTPTQAGQVISGQVPCSGAIFRLGKEGEPPELVAWGFRNPFGLALSPAGELYVTDNAYDDRGSRPVHGAGDLLWKITPGTWYGWPDYHGARPLNTGDHYLPPGKERPRLLLSEPPNDPPKPAAVLEVHSSSNGFDFSRNTDFGYIGEAFIAQFGDQAPATGKVFAPVGFKVVRVDPGTGIINDFAVNRGPTNGPASRIGGGGLERPVAARFNPKGTALYVVDFGVLTMGEKMKKPPGASEPMAKEQPYQGTGVLWRIVRKIPSPPMKGASR
ncbi:MAG: glucose dehydrogenase [Nitrospirae bacterium]|nr:glucose dehydrogenase [Candidatus Manganitrophaceae bacterium]